MTARRTRVSFAIWRPTQWAEHLVLSRECAGDDAAAVQAAVIAEANRLAAQTGDRYTVSRSESATVHVAPAREGVA